MINDEVDRQICKVMKPWSGSTSMPSDEGGSGSTSMQSDEIIELIDKYFKGRKDGNVDNKVENGWKNLWFGAGKTEYFIEKPNFYEHRQGLNAAMHQDGRLLWNAAYHCIKK